MEWAYRGDNYCAGSVHFAKKNEARGRAVQSKNPRERLVCRFSKVTPYALNSQTRNAEHNKAIMTNPEIITKYFHDLGEIIRNLGLEPKPSCIWIFDETGKSFEHQPVRIIAEKGSKTVVGRTSSCRTNITGMACVNAAGSKMSHLANC